MYLKLLALIALLLITACERPPKDPLARYYITQCYEVPDSLKQIHASYVINIIETTLKTEQLGTEVNHEEIIEQAKETADEVFMTKVDCLVIPDGTSHNISKLDERLKAIYLQLKARQ